MLKKATSTLTKTIRFSFATAPLKFTTVDDIPKDLETKKMNLMGGITEALDTNMKADNDMFLCGLDVKFGGVFRVTSGLYEKYGADRVFNCPLSELGICGFAVGLASIGKRVVAEIQFGDYIFPGMDQITNEAAKFRFRSGSVFDVGGLTIRTPIGAVGHGGNYHSQSPEAYFTHTPGLTVIMPSNPAKAKGLMLSAIRTPNPVIFMEPKGLYRTVEGEVPVADYELELQKAHVLKKGKNITLVAYGPTVKTIEAAAKMAKEKDNIDCEVIDLQTLYPFDIETLKNSVNKTGRMVICHEACESSGLGAEIAARVQQKCFLKLEAPIGRVCGYDTGFPMSLEPFFVPSPAKVYEEIKNQMAF